MINWRQQDPMPRRQPCGRQNRFRRRPGHGKQQAARNCLSAGREFSGQPVSREMRQEAPGGRTSCRRAHGDIAGGNHRYGNMRIRLPMVLNGKRHPCRAGIPLRGGAPSHAARAHLKCSYRIATKAGGAANPRDRDGTLKTGRDRTGRWAMDICTGMQ